jgi:hypothetical protein
MNINLKMASWLIPFMVSICLLAYFGFSSLLELKAIDQTINPGKYYSALIGGLIFSFLAITPLVLLLFQWLKSVYKSRNL